MQQRFVEKGSSGLVNLSKEMSRCVQDGLEVVLELLCSAVGDESQRKKVLFKLNVGNIINIKSSIQYVWNGSLIGKHINEIINRSQQKEN